MIAKAILPLVLAVWTWGPPTGAVQEVRIAQVEEETEITVVLEGDVAVTDFLLSNPARLILDVENAANALPRRTFEGVGRGGVVRIRSSQFREDVVRLVFDLTTQAEYDLDRQGDLVRIRFRNPGEAFATWSSGGGQLASAEPSAAALAAPTPEPERTRPSRAASGSGADTREEPPTARPMSSRKVPSVSDQPRITVAFDSASMLDVLSGFSEFAGVSIVPNGDLGGVKVRGIDVRNQPWDVALSAILSAQGLGWITTESGIIIVDNLENLAKREELTTETRVFRINYASADSVARTLQELATRDRGQVVSYQGTNSVIVTDAPSVVARMDSLVAALDRRTPQVSIEAKIVFVDRTDVNELGIIYDLKQRNGGFVTHGVGNPAVPVPDPTQPPQIVRIGDEEFAFYRLTNETIVDVGGDAIAGLANANDRVASPALQILTALAFGNFSLFTFIEALESHQLSDVQAAPSIQVVDNHRARIQVGERTPIRVLERGAQTEDATVNVQFEDTGIILEVTPHITNNNQILLDLSAERSSLQVGLSDVGFIFNRQVGDTRLLLDDGETAVIGGLTLSEVTRSESGIPGLMNLPLLGNLFRTTREQERKQDLIILVTPHIVFPGGEAPTEVPTE